MSGILYGVKHGRLLTTPLDWAACGTAANYRAHLRHGEKPCEACTRAQARYKADNKRKRREAEGAP